MELELNKKLINFLNKAYKVDFNKAKILDFSVNKETGPIFLIDCGNDCFIFEFTSYKDIKFITKVFPQKDKTIKYCRNNKNGTIFLDMQKDDKYYSFYKLENNIYSINEVFFLNVIKNFKIYEEENILQSKTASVLIVLENQQ